MSVPQTRVLLFLRCFLWALEGDVTTIVLERLRGRVTLIFGAEVNDIFRGLVSFPFGSVRVRSVLYRPFPSLLRLRYGTTLLRSRLRWDLGVVVAQEPATQQ